MQLKLHIFVMQIICTFYHINEYILLTLKYKINTFLISSNTK